MFAAYRQLPQSTAQSTMAILMEAPSAMDILRHYRIPVSVADAHDYLRELTERVGLLGLYQHFFPEEYAASEASLVGGYEGTYSPREVEFSELVNERMFPLELDFEDERLGLIPVYGIGFNGWEWGVEDMRPAWRMMMLLAGEDLDEPVEAWQEHMSKWLDDETVAILHAQVQPLDNLSVERLEGACRDMPPLLSELPRALEVMYR